MSKISFFGYFWANWNSVLTLWVFLNKSYCICTQNQTKYHLSEVPPFHFRISLCPKTYFNVAIILVSHSVLMILFSPISTKMVATWVKACVLLKKVKRTYSHAFVRIQMQRECSEDHKWSENMQRNSRNYSEIWDTDLQSKLPDRTAWHFHSRSYYDFKGAVLLSSSIYRKLSSLNRRKTKSDQTTQHEHFRHNVTKQKS